MIVTRRTIIIINSLWIYLSWAKNISLSTFISILSKLISYTANRYPHKPQFWKLWDFFNYSRRIKCHKCVLIKKLMSLECTVYMFYEAITGDTSKCTCWETHFSFTLFRLNCVMRNSSGREITEEIDVVWVKNWEESLSRYRLEMICRHRPQCALLILR